MNAQLSTAKSVTLYALLVAAIFVASTVLLTLIHEVAGHLAFAYAFGADIKGFEVRPFGGGRAYYVFDESTAMMPRVLATAGGLISTVLLAGAALVAIAWLKRKQRVVLALACGIFGAGGVLGSLGYVALGSYYGKGDPASILRRLGYSAVSPSTTWWIWGLSVALIGLTAWWLSRLYFSIQESWWPSRTIARRLVVGSTAVSVALCVFLVGRWMSTPVLEFRAEDIVFQENADTIVARLKTESAKLKEEHPQLSDEERHLHLEKVLKAAQQEVLEKHPKPLPLMPLIGLVLVVGGLSGVRHQPRQDHIHRVKHSRVVAFGATAVAVILVAVFALRPSWPL